MCQSIGHHHILAVTQPTPMELLKHGFAETALSWQNTSHNASSVGFHPRQLGQLFISRMSFTRHIHSSRTPLVGCFNPSEKY